MGPPEDLPALQRFLGIVQYCAKPKFIPNLSTIAGPLQELLRKDFAWVWQAPQQAAFETIKQLMSSPPVLRYYDVQKPVVLTADASKDGLGAACLQHGMPVAYASRALTSAEVNYAHIEKELLAVLFACMRFHDYVYGREVVVETDHKPLVTIMKKALYLAPPRLQRMLLKLQKYDIQLVYKKGSELYLADTLSRAYPKDHSQSTDEDDDLEVMTVWPFTSGETKKTARGNLQ